MSSTDRLDLPYIAPQQAQKHVTHNDAIRRLDAIVQASVKDRDLAAPPGSPAAGDAYIAASGASGDWAGGVGALFVFQDGAWARFDPQPGWIVWVEDEDAAVAWNGSGWIGVGGAGGLSTADLASGAADRIGVNTASDTTNRLAVKSDALLFNHDDVTPGSGDCRLAINKSTPAGTSSLIFQSAASGKAEFGLLGDDALRMKVSADNFATSNDTMSIETATGELTFHRVATFANTSGYITVTNTLSDMTNKSGLVSVSHFNMAEEPVSVFGALISAGANQVLYGWSGSLNAPTSHEFFTGPTTTTLTGTKKAYVRNGFVVGAPVGGDKGEGTINATAVYDDNALLSCYVFDQVLDGRTEFAKWDAKTPDRIVETLDGEGRTVTVKTERRTHQPARRFRARIGTAEDPLTLDGYAKHWKEKRHLTSMPNEAIFNVEAGMSTGDWIQRLVETVEIQAVLIEALNQRTKGDARSAGSGTDQRNPPGARSAPQ